MHSLKNIPAEYREFIPREARDFLNGLTHSDKADLKETAKDYATYKNEDEALAALKEKSSELGAKAEKRAQFGRNSHRLKAH
ncbi:unnamed protein product [Haemonchus placei]|uniref:DUF3460 family protein n=1 Tax=Haemonchus placei TaxID=6290 RepID=A0A0N4VUU5_HAEPC|nr:unnamed protein product [Haemonchus placei]